jgi:hypothetical protein
MFLLLWNKRWPRKPAKDARMPSRPGTVAPEACDGGLGTSGAAGPVALTGAGSAASSQSLAAAGWNRLLGTAAANTGRAAKVRRQGRGVRC